MTEIPTPATDPLVQLLAEQGVRAPDVLADAIRLEFTVTSAQLLDALDRAAPPETHFPAALPNRTARDGVSAVRVDAGRSDGASGIGGAWCRNAGGAS